MSGGEVVVSGGEVIVSSRDIGLVRRLEVEMVRRIESVTQSDIATAEAEGGGGR